VGTSLRSTEDLRKVADNLRKCTEKERETAVEEPASSWLKRSPCCRQGLRTDSGAIARRSFWSTHVEAMNFNGMGLPGMP
jgi:hypothetical protein